MSGRIDTYLEKLFALAHVHALLGSTVQEFEADLARRAIPDDTELSKLSQEEFNQVNNANTTVRLKGNKPESDDQDIYDKTAFLACVINARLAAAAKAQHPEQYDITKPEERLAMTNAAANGVFNKYYNGMGSCEATKSMTNSTIRKTYFSASVKMDAIRDIFSSLALPDSALAMLLNAVQSFIDTTKELAIESKKKDLHDAKLVNFISIQPPLGNPDLRHVPKMRMIYVQFTETTSEWTSNCSKGETYDLDVSVYAFAPSLVEMPWSLCMRNVRNFYLRQQMST
ncbi:hypothetical protein COL922a_013473 [Colletotrichum nupharicola]|nr:hypothetical protein COL922a_013473 [Colletotrichum nupharicola]